MMKIALLLCILSLPLYPGQNSRRATDAAIQMAVKLLTDFGDSAIVGDEKILDDMIAGSCAYKGGVCNGAKVTLFKNQKVFKILTLTSQGLFKFPNLKRANYKVKVEFPKYKLNKESKVLRGQFVQILLQDKK